ncbi:hypothetical protein A3H16_01330 [Candidatus Kaiserbacteria bacterium RIFCSPLOWO2_12_FULL_53_8]|uniref:Orotate phosphoribosyltransferase n=1 Tax=Candidatus Kaiserbacteria bacterium RIFCSPLOWO2_12_FULL_53_8 TaxID=1798529 RepID=A0A1F6G2J1_9BACT|nr:MAG: hypothetical protein A3H16_01330 [Candidatus Kaiserbacteria bacterium RIFCSPLOWO2_12_FULL_53_8]
MTEEEALDLLQRVGAFRTGHFVFTSGQHSDTYINKDMIFVHPRDTSLLCKGFAEAFKDANIEAVIAPAVGAIILSQWTAYHLGEMTGRDVYGLYADKDGEGGLVIRRGYDKIIAGKRTLAVEDLLTTGGSLKKVVEAARAAGANVVGAMAIGNRGGVTREAVGNPERFESLVDVHLEQWPEEECELCKKGIPVNPDIGHGKEFLARQKKETS